MCLTDDMGWKKTAAVLVIVCLTLLNVWFARNVARPRNEQKVSEQTMRPSSRTKMSDILVISINDIHPIEHLKEARAMKREQSTTTSSYQAFDKAIQLKAGMGDRNGHVTLDPLTRLGNTETFSDKIINLKLRLENLKDDVMIKKLRQWT